MTMSSFAWVTDSERLADRALLEAEAMGWLPLEAGADLHVGDPYEEEVVITVTGVPDAGMVGMNVLLVG